MNEKEGQSLEADCPSFSFIGKCFLYRKKLI